MGLRQPSKTAAFFAQAKTGAERQQQARETLKKPQALGGAAAVGTQMVAATTGAQQQATQQVQKTGQEATTNLVTKVAPSQTATVVRGATDQGTGLSGQNTLTVTSGESGDVGAVEASGTAIDTAIKGITDQVNKINDDITSANAADRKVLEDEKNRLNTLLQTYRDKLSKENLGQIAGPSTMGTELLKREQLLKEKTNDVAKLQALFGSKWNAERYGSLGSQIYGKDLEAIQKAAAAGLEEKQRAESAADVAKKEYTEKLEAGKKGYESALEKETKKLDILKLSPQELSAYSRKELEDIFGKDQVTKLFNFDKDDKVTGTTVSATRSTLEDRRTKLTAEQAKIATEKVKAQGVLEKNVSDLKSKLFGGPNNPSGSIDRNIGAVENMLQASLDTKSALDNTPNWRRSKGHSKRSWAADESANILRKTSADIRRLKVEAEQAIKQNDIKKVQELEKRILERFQQGYYAASKIKTEANI